MATTPTTSKMEYIYPARDQDPWYETFEAFMNQLDSDVWVGVEDPNLIIRGGGDIVLDAASDELSWTEDIEIVSLLNGAKVTIESTSSPLTGFEDGKIAYVEVSRPVRGDTIGTLSVTDTIGSNRNYVFIALRDGTSFYLRNAGQLSRYVITDRGETTGSVASGGGTTTGDLTINIDEGVVWKLTLDAAGNTTNTDIELFRDAGLTQKVWEATGIDCYTSQYVKEFIAWGTFTDRELHYRIINNGANSSTYDLAIRSFGQVD